MLYVLAHRSFNVQYDEERFGVEMEQELEKARDDGGGTHVAVAHAGTECRTSGKNNIRRDGYRTGKIKILRVIGKFAFPACMFFNEKR